MVSEDFDRFNIQILTIFKTSHKAGIFKVKSRPFAALSFRLSGTGVFCINGKKLISNPGDLLYIPADASYEVEYSVSEMIVVHLLECNYSEPLVFFAQDQKAVQVQMVRLLEEWAQPCSSYRAKAHIYHLLDTVVSNPEPPSERDLFGRCVQYMKEHFDEADMNIERLCKQMFVSRSTLQRMFSDRLGSSPHQYLMKLRVEHSLVLLANGQLTVKEVSHACGFLDEKYFSVAFKKMYGYSPSRLRNNLKM